LYRDELRLCYSDREEGDARDGLPQEGPEEEVQRHLKTSQNALHGVKNGCTGRRRSGRGSSGRTIPPSRHLALDAVPGLSVQLTKSTTLTASTRSSSPAGNKMAWGAFCGTTKSKLVFIPGQAKSTRKRTWSKLRNLCYSPFGTSTAKSMDGLSFKKATLQAKEQPDTSNA